MGKKLKCKKCKKTLDFFLHECRKGVQEIYGCNICNNWCIVCKPNWNKNSKEKNK